MVGLPMSNSEQQISTETALALLTKRQRRRILRRVADTPDGTTVDRLTQHLRGTGSPKPGGDDSVERRDIELRHVHLPMLRGANVVAYDAGQGTVRRDRAFRDVFSLLEVIDDHREETSTALS